MRPIPHDSQPDSTSYTLYSGETPEAGGEAEGLCPQVQLLKWVLLL